LDGLLSEDKTLENLSINSPKCYLTNSITAQSFTVENSGDVIMLAKNNITLKNGFSATEGSQFSASIFPSTEGGSSPPLSKETVDSITDSEGNKPKIVENKESNDDITFTSPSLDENETEEQYLTEYNLSMNYPNPFNPITTIKYALPKNIQIKLKVYNSNGQEVVTLINRYETAGYKSIVWDGTDNSGASVPSGVYFYIIEAGNFIMSYKMVLCK
jgi:hypothetical protein